MNDSEMGLAPGSLELLLFCVHHLPGSRSLGWARPHHLHQSQYPELTGPGFCESASLAGRPAPLPLSCFEAAHNHPRQGCWVMWSGGFRVTPLPSSSATPSGHSHRVFAENTHCLCPSRPGACPYLHPLVSIHFAALDQLDVGRLLQGPEGHGGGLGRVGGRIGELRQRNSEKADEAGGHWGWGEGVAGLQPGSVPAHNAILYQKTCHRDTPTAPRPPNTAWHTVLPTGQEAGGAGRQGSQRARPGGCPGTSRQAPNPAQRPKSQS